MITSLLTKRWPRARGSCRSPGRGLLVPVSAVLCGAGVALTLAAGPAGAQTAPAPPLPGVTLGAAATGLRMPYLFYTGTDRQVWMRDLSAPGSSPVSLGGQLIGGPAAVWIPPASQIPSGVVAVFGRGTDNALWWRHQTSVGWSPWASLGGRLTSKPAATATPYLSGPGDNSVFVVARGTDGAVWLRALQPAGTPLRLTWGPWGSVDGRVLPGTAPAVALTVGILVAAAGTDRAVWVAENLYGSPGFRWHSIGGRTSSGPGIAVPADGVAAAFARGLDNAAWYYEFRGQTAGVTVGWHSLGGDLTSGVTALTAVQGFQTGSTYVLALGAGSQPQMASGVWPAINGWTRP